MIAAARAISAVRPTLKTLAACALFTCAAAASAQDRWNGADKPKHFAVSAVSAATVEGLFANSLSPLQRFGLAMAPGVAKELADMRRGGSGFSGKDLVADAIGAASGMALHGLIIRPGFIGFQLKF